MLSLDVDRFVLGSRDPISDSDQDVDKENDEKRLGNVRNHVGIIQC
jgi:hypothetical protein